MGEFLAMKELLDRVVPGINPVIAIPEIASEKIILAPEDKAIFDELVNRIITSRDYVVEHLLSRVLKDLKIDEFVRAKGRDEILRMVKDLIPQEVIEHCNGLGIDVMDFMTKQIDTFLSSMSEDETC